MKQFVNFLDWEKENHKGSDVTCEAFSEILNRVFPEAYIYNISQALHFKKIEIRF